MFLGDSGGEVSKGSAFGSRCVQDSADSGRYLFTAAISNCDGQVSRLKASRRFHGLLEGTDRGVGQDVHLPGDMDAPLTVSREALGDGGLRKLHQECDFGRIAPTGVVSRSYPNSDVPDSEISAPAQDFFQMFGTTLMADAEVGESRRPGPPPIAIHDHGDVVRHRYSHHPPPQPLFIEGVNRGSQSHPSTLSPRSAVPRLMQGPAEALGVESAQERSWYPTVENVVGGGSVPLAGSGYG